MKTDPIALQKVTDFFASIGLTITVVSTDQFKNQDPWRGASGTLIEPWTVKYVGRTGIEVSDEVSLAYLIHEALHLLFARPAWDHTVSDSVYNWHKAGSMISEEIVLVTFGFQVMKTLNVLNAAIKSSKTEDGTWKHSGREMLLTNRFPYTRYIPYAMACGVADAKGNLIGFFDPIVATRPRNASIISDQVGGAFGVDCDGLGLAAHKGSAVDRADRLQKRNVA